MKALNPILLFLVLSQSVFAHSSSEDAAISFEEQKADIVVLQTEINSITGEEEPSVVMLKNQETGNTAIVGLDQDPKKAKVKALLAIRLKFPELIGFRAGVNIADLVDLGIEIGVGLFFNSVGGFANLYPLGFKAGGIRNLYIGGRLQQETIFAIFALATGPRAEGVIGYKFDKKRGGFHSFIEVGGGAQVGPYKYSSGGTETEYDPLFFPVVTFGLGWTIPRR